MFARVREASTTSTFFQVPWTQCRTLRLDLHGSLSGFPGASTSTPGRYTMHKISFGRPAPDEYADFYRAYVAAVPDGDIIRILSDQLIETDLFLESIPADKIDYRYAPGKWTTREVVGHMVDTERLFSYRTFRFARGDKTPLAGLDQDLIMSGANFEARKMQSLRREFSHLRSATIALCADFDEEILGRTGTASDCSFTVRASIYIIAGHAIHHVRVLKDLYV